MYAKTITVERTSSDQNEINSRFNIKLNFKLRHKPGINPNRVCVQGVESKISLQYQGGNLNIIK